MHDNQPLYNSRITKTYINYLSRYYPGVDINDLLADAGIERYQVEDPAHWFTQRQVDRFQDGVLNKTGNPDISREVGRYIVSSEGMGAGKAYILGLMGPAALYTLMEKNYRILSRGVDVIAKKRGARSVEIISTPRAGVEEKPYQCANRAGTFESLAKLFTSEFADVQHPQCIHRGDPHCRYIVTWKRSPSHAWRRMSMMLALSSLGLLPVLYTMVPLTAWLFILMITVNAETMILGIAEHLERNRLKKPSAIRRRPRRNSWQKVKFVTAMPC